MSMPKEHQFNKTGAEWELDVIAAATKGGKFCTVTFRRAGSGNYTVTNHPTVDAAVSEAIKHTNEQVTPKPRCLVYAVSPTGRWVLIPPDKWRVGAPVLKPTVPAKCTGCGAAGSVKLIAGEPWHASCWRSSRL